MITNKLTKPIIMNNIGSKRQGKQRVTYSNDNEEDYVAPPAQASSSKRATNHSETDDENLSSDSASPEPERVTPAKRREKKQSTVASEPAESCNPGEWRLIRTNNEPTAEEEEDKDRITVLEYRIQRLETLVEQLTGGGQANMQLARPRDMRFEVDRHLRTLQERRALEDREIHWSLMHGHPPPGFQGY